MDLAAAVSSAMPATSTADVVRIRPVTLADAEAVLALWRVVFPEYGDPFHPQRSAAASIARKLAVGDDCSGWRSGRGGLWGPPWRATTATVAGSTQSASTRRRAAAGSGEGSWPRRSARWRRWA